MEVLSMLSFNCISSCLKPGIWMLSPRSNQILFYTGLLGRDTGDVGVVHLSSSIKLLLDQVFFSFSFSNFVCFFRKWKIHVPTAVIPNIGPLMHVGREISPPIQLLSTSFICISRVSGPGRRAPRFEGNIKKSQCSLPDHAKRTRHTLL